MGTHKKCLSRALLMSTHNICYHGKKYKKKKKILFGLRKPTLSGAMKY